MMDEKELQEEMKSMIDEEGLGKPKALKIETPWERQQRRYRPVRHSRLGRALGYMFLGPILLAALVVGAVVGGIVMYWALDGLQRFHG